MGTMASVHDVYSRKRGGNLLNDCVLNGFVPCTQENELYGLNLLVFDVHQGIIVDVVGFRQPLVSEHEHIFKASHQGRGGHHAHQNKYATCKCLINTTQVKCVLHSCVLSIAALLSVMM